MGPGWTAGKTDPLEIFEIELSYDGYGFIRVDLVIDHLPEQVFA
jgi:hypothetical protein